MVKLPAVRSFSRAGLIVLARVVLVGITQERLLFVVDVVILAAVVTPIVVGGWNGGCGLAAEPKLLTSESSAKMLRRIHHNCWSLRVRAPA